MKSNIIKQSSVSMTEQKMYFEILFSFTDILLTGYISIQEKLNALIKNAYIPQCSLHPRKFVYFKTHSSNIRLYYFCLQKFSSYNSIILPTPSSA